MHARGVRATGAVEDRRRAGADRSIVTFIQLVLCGRALVEDWILDPKGTSQRGQCARCFFTLPASSTTHLHRDEVLGRAEIFRALDLVR